MGTKTDGYTPNRWFYKLREGALMDKVNAAFDNADSAIQSAIRYGNIVRLG